MQYFSATGLSASLFPFQHKTSLTHSAERFFPVFIQVIRQAHKIVTASSPQAAVSQSAAVL